MQTRTHTLTLTPVGDAVGVILPQEILDRLQVAAGDTLFLTETAAGILLSPVDPEVSAQLAAARRVMQARWAALHELAR